MSIKITQVHYQPLPTGEYKAEIINIEITEGQYGEQLKFTFNLHDQKENRTLIGWASAKFSSKSKLYAWTKAALGGNDIPPSMGFDSDNLIGRNVILVVTEKQGDNGIINKIEALKPCDEVQTDTRQPDVPQVTSPPDTPPDIFD